MPNAYLDQLDDEREELIPMGEPPDVFPMPDPLPMAPPAQAPVGEAVASFQPQPYGQGADAAALAEAEHSRDDSDRAIQLLTAASLFNRAGGGHAGDLAAGARAGREDAFKDVARRRALSDQDQARGKATHDAAMQGALTRGDSPESLKIKEAFGGTTVGARLRQQMGEEAWAKLPGSAIPGAKEQLSSETSLLLGGMKADAKHGADEAGRQATLRALIDAAGGPQSPRGQFFSQSFADAPLQVISSRGFGLLSAEEQKAFQSEQNNLNRKATVDAAHIAAGRKLEERREKQTEDIATDVKEGAGFGSALRQVNEVLNKTSTKDSGDIPGVGPADAARNEYFGGYLETNPEGMKLNKAARQIQLAYRNLVTGSAASNQEDKKIAQAGLSFVNENAFRVGLDVMQQRYYDLLKRTYAGKDPRAVQVFIARNPDYEIPGDPRFGAQVAKQGATKYAALSNFNDLQPDIVELGRIAAPTEPPVREPGGAVAPVPEPTTGNTVQMKGPDGKLYVVPSDKVEEAISKYKFEKM